MLQKGNFCSFNFKNRSVQQCLLKSGVLLELYITIIAESIEENGQKIYNDVMMGAQIDWDGIKSPMSGIDVANEIDVVLMRGLRPIFISCKNGSFLPEELYKLSAVAKHFGGVEHRIELVRVKDGVRFYNDSIASSPTRTIAGLQSFSQKVLLIAGGYDKHIPFEVLGPYVLEHTKAVFLNGATAQKIRKAIENAPGYTPGNPELVDCADFTDAVKKAAQAAKDGDVVLMSPACAAFDQFKDFMERGKYYKQQIMEL